MYGCVTMTAETAPATHLHATPGSSRGHMRIRLVVLPHAVRGQTEDHLGDHGKAEGRPFLPSSLVLVVYTDSPRRRRCSSPTGFWHQHGQKRKHKRTPPAVCPLLRPASVRALLLPKRARAQRPMNLIRPMPPCPARLVTQMRGRGRRPGCWLLAAGFGR